MLPLRRTSYLLEMASRTEWFKEFVRSLDKLEQLLHWNQNDDWDRQQGVCMDVVPR